MAPFAAEAISSVARVAAMVASGLCAHHAPGAPARGMRRSAQAAGGCVVWVAHVAHLVSKAAAQLTRQMDQELRRTQAARKLCMLHPARQTPPTLKPMRDSRGK